MSGQVVPQAEEEYTMIGKIISHYPPLAGKILEELGRGGRNPDKSGQAVPRDRKEVFCDW